MTFSNLVIGNLANLDIKTLKKLSFSGLKLLQPELWMDTAMEVTISMQKFHVVLKDLDIPTNRIFR